MTIVSTGLDRLDSGEWRRFKGQRLGLLSNQASLTRNFKSARDVVTRRLPGQLKALFGPQHGHGGADQDNMIETPHDVDDGLNIPVFSLYAEARCPNSEMFDSMDTLLVDLQDVGTRVYTFSSTLLECLKAAAGYGKKVVVLDRPNPVGGDILEGNLLETDLFSFVGPAALPMRHGLTMGEMALIFKAVYNLDCDLEVISMAGWRRQMNWPETGLPWLMPSPNMPCAETALVYPGQVLWEGTHVSEGRGTCRPFEIFGAPYFEPEKIRSFLDPGALKGCCLQDYTFRPTFHKWADDLCHGFMIHIRDRRFFRPFHLSMAVLGAVLELYGDKFEWKEPPYEYEYEKKPIDMILGNVEIRRKLESGVKVDELKNHYGTALEDFNRWRKSYLLYP